MTCNKEHTPTARANKIIYVQLIFMYVVLFRNHFPRESLVWGGGGGSLELTVSRKMAKKN